MLIELTPAAQTWNDLLPRDPARLAQDLASEMKDTFFPQDPQHVPLRPLFLPKTGFREVTEVAATAVRLIGETFARLEAMSPGKLTAISGLHSDVYPLLREGLATKAAALRIARPDLVLSGGRPYVMEMNIGSALGGILEMHQMTRLFSDTPMARVAAKTHSFHSESPLVAIADFLKSYARQHGLPSPPQVGILEWDFNREINERYAAELRALGLPAAFIQPEECELVDGQLVHKGLSLDIGVKHYHITDLEFPEDTPYLQNLFGANRREGTHLLSHESATLLSDKRLLAVLHELKSEMPDADKTWIERYVPLTYSLNPDLPLADRARWVLKPANGLQGQGVTIGSEVSAAEWDSKIRMGLEAGSFLLQEFKAPDRHVFPFSIEGRIVDKECRFILGAFVIDGRGMDSLLVRLVPVSAKGAINHHVGAHIGFAYCETVKHV